MRAAVRPTARRAIEGGLRAATSTSPPVQVLFTDESPPTHCTGTADADEFEIGLCKENLVADADAEADPLNIGDIACVCVEMSVAQDLLCVEVYDTELLAEADGVDDTEHENCSDADCEDEAASDDVCVCEPVMVCVGDTLCEDGIDSEHVAVCDALTELEEVIVCEGDDEPVALFDWLALNELERL